MLIETPEGVINTDHLVSAGPVPGAATGERSLCNFANGTKANVRIGLWQFEQACGVIIPAHPDFWLVQAFMPSEPETPIRYVVDAVLAFRVGHGGSHHGPMPITLDGEPTTLGRARWTVRQANGRCVGPDGDHETLQEFKAECEREAARLCSAA